ncbi:hypothetical protein QQF64_015220 [Cirrhinus molitorella]|uniref:Ig-like domain-containing protein n=1 Tax=Cirrhinus molitorella TaxID=172907 RepID=A0ABR3NUB2_9TELE
MTHWIKQAIVVFIYVWGIESQESVEQKTRFQTANEDSLYWYRQYGRSTPEFLVLTFSSEKEVKRSDVDPRFTVKVDKKEQIRVYLEISSAARANDLPRYILRTEKYGGEDKDAQFQERFHSNLSSDSVPLTIQDVRVSDSAVYYCALRPTRANDLPRYILRTDKYGGEDKDAQFQERFHSNLSSDSVPLTIQDVRVSDSVVYYCALRPTRPNDFPKYILRRSKYGGDNGTEFQERFHSKLSSDSVPLTIQDVRVSDSAVYYCALRPTIISTGTISMEDQNLNFLYSPTVGKELSSLM